MKKKWLTLICMCIAIATTLCFVGCGDTSSEEPAATEAVTEEPAEEATETTTEVKDTGDIIKEQVQQDVVAHYGTGDATEFSEAIVSVMYSETGTENEYSLEGHISYPKDGEYWRGDFTGMCTVTGEVCTTHDMEYGEAYKDED